MKPSQRVFGRPDVLLVEDEALLIQLPTPNNAAGGLDPDTQMGQSEEDEAAGPARVFVGGGQGSPGGGVVLAAAPGALIPDAMLQLEHVLGPSPERRSRDLPPQSASGVRLRLVPDSSSLGDVGPERRRPTLDPNGGQLPRQDFPVELRRSDRPSFSTSPLSTNPLSASSLPPSSLSPSSLSPSSLSPSSLSPNPLLPDDGAWRQNGRPRVPVERNLRRTFGELPEGRPPAAGEGEPSGMATLDGRPPRSREASLEISEGGRVRPEGGGFSLDPQPYEPRAAAGARPSEQPRRALSADPFEQQTEEIPTEDFRPGGPRSDDPRTVDPRTGLPRQTRGEILRERMDNPGSAPVVNRADEALGPRAELDMGAPRPEPRVNEVVSARTPPRPVAARPQPVPWAGMMLVVLLGGIVGGAGFGWYYGLRSWAAWQQVLVAVQQKVEATLGGSPTPSTPPERTAERPVLKDPSEMEEPPGKTPDATSEGAAGGPAGTSPAGSSGPSSGTASSGTASSGTASAGTASSEAAARPEAPRTGTLRIVAEKGARILVDDKLVGIAPLKKPLELDAGQHDVKVISPGGRPQLSRVRVDAGKDSTFEVKPGR